MPADHSNPMQPTRAGAFESISEHFARGWAVDRESPGAPLEVELLAEGEVIATASTGLPRPDVKRRLGAENAGFRIPLPADVKRADRLAVRLADTSAPLPRAVGFSVSGAAMLREMANDRLRHGCIDEVTGNRVKGWAALPDRDEPVQVLFYAGKKLVGSVLAAEDRPDVEAVGVGPRRSGFQTELRLPRIGGWIEICARVRDGAELAGGTFRMACPEPSRTSPLHFAATPGIPPAARETPEGTRYGFADRAPITLAGRDDGKLDLFFGVTRLGVLPKSRLLIAPTGTAATPGSHLLASLAMLSAFTDRRDDCLTLGGEQAPLHLMSDPALFRCLRLQGMARPVAIRDASFVTSRRLRLVFACESDAGADTDVASVAVYQLASGGQRLALCGQASAREAFGGGEVILDAELPDSFRPLVVTLTDTEGELLDTDLLPFPSLCRGGWHEPELRSLAREDNEQQALAQLSGKLMQALWLRDGCGPRIAIDERGITGIEPGITSSAAAWIANQLGGQLGLLASDSEGSGEIRPLPLLTGQEADAILPSDALPALSFLVRGRHSGDFVSASYVTADLEHASRCWHVAMPPLGRWFQDVQPAEATPWCPRVRWEAAERPPLTCVRHQRSIVPDVTTTFFPLRPDTAEPVTGPDAEDSITILLFANTAASSFLAAVEAIAQQSIASRCDLLVCDLDPAAELPPIVDRHFANRARLLTGRSLGEALALVAKGELASAPTIAVCAGTAILHDIWTLHALQQVSLAPEVGWVSCPIVTGSGAKLNIESWGSAITGVSVLSQPTVQLTPWAIELMPAMAAVPVGVTPATIGVVGADRLARLDPAGLDHPSWAVAALNAGLVNLCLTTVTAFSSIPLEPSNRRPGPVLGSVGEIDQLLRVSSVPRWRPR